MVDKNIKLISITWSHDGHSDYQDSLLYKSFLKTNNIDDFINIHFDRSEYIDIEREFEVKYGYQYEYILYKIFLLKEKLKNIHSINFSDEIVFSSEKHQYPTDHSGWEPASQYRENNITDRNYLNSGVIFCKKINYLNLLEAVIRNVMIHDHKNFGGDQGVYTYHYINNMDPEIRLENSVLINKTHNNIPTFIHDNGWNYGGSKFQEFFKL